MQIPIPGASNQGFVKEGSLKRTPSEEKEKLEETAVLYTKTKALASRQSDNTLDNWILWQTLDRGRGNLKHMTPF
ncbi:hypothetical protein GLAREA_00725 [Glarea lozoyensis ATCC 20868]|uniref:Uncharacterized protein n=1 Tax=Glarea lozoyensis (strain ATCC 20868 / MF5171) TaxID=1116229 RepID=S3CV76_GLAL2|nr:uncharacterized protein GLAREA_00725 [Glarea lozoyensis ATCC 20868]EPE29565.1 hypothetical protein GLAREA_00725 [Glarea lozoyensis ATCC 20868]